MTGSSPRPHGAIPADADPARASARLTAGAGAGPEAEAEAAAPPPERVPIRPEGAVLAWLVPGLGHLYVGHRRRGLLIMLATAILIAGGLLVGGPDVVDRKNDRLWFIAQAGCGPIVFVLDLVRERVSPAQSYDFTARARSEDRQRYADEDPEMNRMLRRASIGHVNEIGTLYIALAGLMNLVVVLDFLNPHRIPSPREQHRMPPGGTTGIRRSPGAVS